MSNENRAMRAAPADSLPSGRGALRTRLLSRRFVTLLVAQACFGYAFSAWLLLPKFLATELAVGPAAIGQLGAANGLAAVAFMFAMGALVDGHGRRRFMIAGSLLMTAANLVFLCVSEFGALIYAVRITQGLAFSMVYVAGAALAVDEAPPERLGQALGLFGLTMLSMNAIAPTLVETLAASHGWMPAFATAAAGSLLSALLSLRIEEGRREECAPRVWARLARVARQPDQIRAALVIALVGCCFGTLFVFNQLYALELGMTRLRTFFVAYALGAAFARLGLGHVGDRHGRLRVSALMLLLYAAAAFGMIRLAELGLAPLGALFGLAHGLFYPTFNALVLGRVAEAERGKVVALVQGWFNAGLAAGSLGLGWVAETSGYPRVFALAGSGVLIALAVLLWGERVRESRPRAARAPERIGTPVA